MSIFYLLVEAAPALLISSICSKKITHVTARTIIQRLPTIAWHWTCVANTKWSFLAAHCTRICGRKHIVSNTIFVTNMLERITRLYTWYYNKTTSCIRYRRSTTSSLGTTSCRCTRYWCYWRWWWCGSLRHWYWYWYGIRYSYCDNFNIFCLIISFMYYRGARSYLQTK